MSNEQIVLKIQQGGYSSNHLYQQLYEQNIPLIQKIINPFEHYVEHDDLMQEAFFGIVRACEHYESQKEVKFMSFASYWIVRQIQDYMLICGAFRVPAHIRERVPQYNRAVTELSQELNRQPSNEEIAKYMKCKPKTILGIQNFLRGAVSLSTPLTEDEEVTLQDTLQADLSIENDVVEDLYSDYEKKELWTICEAHTTTTEYKVLRCLFINNMTYKQTGELLGVSKQRIEQIKRKAISNLRKTKARRELIEKLEVIESGIYRGSLNQYRLHVNTSIVERTVIRQSEIKQAI